MSTPDKTVAGDEGSRRLDRVLAARLPELSRSRLKALILAGEISLRDAPILDPAYHVAPGDTITIRVPPPVSPEPEPENIPLDIVYEDVPRIPLYQPALSSAMTPKIGGYEYWFHRQPDARPLTKS